MIRLIIFSETLLFLLKKIHLLIKREPICESLFTFFKIFTKSISFLNLSFSKLLIVGIFSLYFYNKIRFSNLI
ncbi:hypothetical protein STURON_00590 [Spiroplasma turonicum]|uniref:Uncharacterized protein n=1 Tax=Spiroplasma turonicum TaxID=216946 RepID=A0A0K1P6A4_9MOLU|nr:hypothetical protein STURON_00590 [Spiroplasma turonicum]